jgi:hypothetical protein
MSGSPRALPCTAPSGSRMRGPTTRTQGPRRGPLAASPLLPPPVDNRVQQEEQRRLRRRDSLVDGTTEADVGRIANERGLWKRLHDGRASIRRCVVYDDGPHAMFARSACTDRSARARSLTGVVVHGRSPRSPAQTAAPGKLRIETLLAQLRGQTIPSRAAV